MSRVKDITYKKRGGTSAIGGHFYETKLISLISYNLLHDDRVDYFYLASNTEDSEFFNDICFKVKIKGIVRPLIVFIQTKHKENDKTVDFDVVKTFNISYYKMVEKFRSDVEANDKIFSGNIEDNEYIFILYTNGRYVLESDVQYVSAYANILNDLLATGTNGTQLLYSDKVIEESAEAILEEEMKSLSEHFMKFLNGKVNQSMQMMFDDYIVKYHVILATQVVNISEIQSDKENADKKWRIITFRENFFESTDKYLKFLKKAINKQTLQNKINEYRNSTLVEDYIQEEQLNTFFKDPSASTLGPLLGIYIEYKNGKLVSINQKSNNIQQELDQVKVPQSTIEEAEALAARDILASLKLRVPITFGNTDLTISDNKTERLTENIVKLCKQFKCVDSYKVVTLDETVEDRMSSALADGVGNLLIYDDNTKLLKFNDNCKPQQNNAKILLAKINSHITDMHQYRFHVKSTIPFPKPAFDFSENAKNIFKKFVIYAQQSNHENVEKILTSQIKNYCETNTPLNMQVRPESIFINYHTAIQEWWLLKDEGTYLTKETQIYQKAINNIIIEPQMSSLKTTFHMTKVKNIEYTTDSLKTLHRVLKKQTDKQILLAVKTVIVTDVINLTVIKVLQLLNDNCFYNYAILDLKNIVNLSTDDFCALKTELKKTDKVLIIMCENLQSSKIWYEKYLKEIVEAAQEKQIILVTNSAFVKTAMNAFSLIENEDKLKQINVEEIIYEKNSLVDLTPDSRKNIMKNAKIMFQGQLLNLDSLFYDTSAAFLEGIVLNRIINNETIEIGESLTDTNYEEIKCLYQDRTVGYVKNLLIPGHVYVTKASYLDNAREFGQHQQNDVIDSRFIIKLQESSNCSSNFENDLVFIKFYFSFYFDPNVPCCGDVVHVTIVVKDESKQERSRQGEQTATYQLSIKKEDALNKIWMGEIKLFVDLRQFRQWQEDKVMVKNTSTALRHLCKGAALDYIIRNESYEIKSTPGHLDIERAKQFFYALMSNKWSLFPESQKQEGTEIAGTSSDSHNAFSGHLTENDIRKFFDIVGSSSDIYNKQRNSGSIAEEVIHKLTLTYAENYFSFVPDIGINANYSNEELSHAEIIDTRKESNDILNKSSMLEPKDTQVHNFHIRFHCRHRNSVKAFNDINNNVVLLTAEAGLGKSTLLTHLSLKHKETDKNVWIVRINLLEYSGEFRKWQQNKNIVVDTLKTLQLMCYVIIKNMNIAIVLKEDCNKVYLEYCSGDEIINMHLNMFLHYYNERKLFFLFDGFDEICPDYKDEVIKFLQAVKDSPQQNKIWITTRPYNAILPELEKHFGTSYILTYFTKNETFNYLTNFWARLNLNHFNEQDVKELIHFMSKIICFLDNRLKIICYHFCDFINTNFQLKESLENIPDLKLYIDKIKSIYLAIDGTVYKEIHEFLGTPLLLYLSVIFFVTEVLNFDDKNKYGKWNFNIISMYDKFTRIKLEKILCQDKCGLNIDMPFIKESCASDLKECIEIHKKLGAHATFGSPLFEKNNLYYEEFKDLAPFEFHGEDKMELNRLIGRISDGKERTGLISYVTSDGTPVFVHKSFTEYFAYEYIHDILKDSGVKYDTKRLILGNVIIIVSQDLEFNECDEELSSNCLNIWLREKCLMDDELRVIVMSILSEHPSVSKYVDVSVEESSFAWKKECADVITSSEDLGDISFIKDNIENYDFFSSQRESYRNTKEVVNFERKFPIVPFENLFL